MKDKTLKMIKDIIPGDELAGGATVLEIASSLANSNDIYQWKSIVGTGEETFFIENKIKKLKDIGARVYSDQGGDKIRVHCIHTDTNYHYMTGIEESCYEKLVHVDWHLVRNNCVRDQMWEEQQKHWDELENELLEKLT